MNLILGVQVVICCCFVSSGFENSGLEQTDEQGVTRMSADLVHAAADSKAADEEEVQDGALHGQPAALPAAATDQPAHLAAIRSAPPPLRQTP